MAISWSGYFTSLVQGFGIHIPEYLTTDFLSASRGFKEATQALQNGTPLSDLSFTLQEAIKAWTTAPLIGNIRIIADIPALAIVVFITWICYIGIRESKVANNIMVLL